MFLSRKSLERVDYAVKKVVLTTGASVSELSLRVLREVRIFARLDHVNIVRFFNAWLEFVPNEKLDKELDNDPASEASFVTQGSSQDLSPLTTNLTQPLATQDVTQLTTQDLTQLTTQEPTLASQSSPSSQLSQSSQSSGASASSDSLFDELDTTSMDWKKEMNRSGDCPFVFADNSLSQFDQAVSSRVFHPSQTTQTTQTNQVTQTTQTNQVTQTLLQSITTQISTSSRFARASLRYAPTSSRSLLRHNALVLYIQMAYCGKRTLNTYLQDPKRVVNEDEILNVCVQLCKALAYMHSKQVIHRDVKPANIFYTEDGDVRLGDFGLSRDLSEADDPAIDSANSSSSHLRSSGSRTDATTTHIGTQIYSSPEQLTSRGHYDYKSDIYAAGVVLYEMSFPPFKTAFEKCEVLNRPRRGALPETHEGISHALYDLIKRMMALDPTKRPTASEAVAEAMMIQEKKRKLIIQLSQEESYSR